MSTAINQNYVGSDGVKRSRMTCYPLISTTENGPFYFFLGDNKSMATSLHHTRVNEIWAISHMHRIFDLSFCKTLRYFHSSLAKSCSPCKNRRCRRVIWKEKAKKRAVYQKCGKETIRSDGVVNFSERELKLQFVT